MKITTEIAQRLQRALSKPQGGRLMTVNPAVFAAIARETIKDPYERLKVLFNAGIRGADLR